MNITILIAGMVIALLVGFLIGRSSKEELVTFYPLPAQQPTDPPIRRAEPKTPRTTEGDRLRGYIAELLEHKRNHHLRWPDLMAQSFLAFNDKEKAEFFSRVAARVRAEQGALMRRRVWQPMIGHMHFDGLFLMHRVLGPMMEKELRFLYLTKPRLERTDDLR